MSRRPSQPTNGAEPDNKDADDQDLTTFLDKDQRADLTLLIANCTERMRKVLIDNFNATAGLSQALLRENMTEDEKMMSTDPKDDISKFENERKLKEANEKDLATLKMKNLKKNSLKAYDEWREQVIMRVGKVVNSPETAKQQLGKESKADLSSPQAPNTVGKITDVPKRNPNLKFKDLFPPTKTPLTKLPMNQRTLVLHALLLLLISLEHYNANSRILMLNLASSLKLPLKTFEQDEYTTAKGLLEAAKELTADEETKKKIEENKDTRKWRVNVATAAGVAIIGITGGFAAPMIAAGVGSVMGGLGLGATAAAGYLGSVAGSTVLVGGLFGAYGGRMTGQMMDAYAREVEDFQFIPVHSNTKTSEDEKQGAEQASDHDHKLRVTICISGWLTEKEEVIKPWRVLGTAAEVFGLKYELEALLNLGNSMNGMVQSAAWGYAQREVIKRTVFADLAASMWPIGLLKVARVIDNPFSVAKARSDKAGEVLADALINKAQGERPVTLIGYSLGARVIYTCLMSLAKRKAFGLIENVVLMGSPTPSDTSDWRVLRTVVAGRLVNVYSENDYILGFMYRTSSLHYGVAGLQPVEGLASVENVDVSEDIDGHLRYRFLVGAILKKIGFADIDMDAVEEEQKALEVIIEEEKKNSLQAQRNRLLRRQSTGGKEDEAAESEHEASELEKQVQAATQKSLVTRAIEYFYAPNIPNAKDAEKVIGNIQKGLNNPADARAAVDDTVSDVQASTQSYAMYIASKLPSMPYMRRSNPTANATGAVEDPTKAAGDATKLASDPTKAADNATKLASDPTKTTGDATKLASDPTSVAGQATKAVGDAAEAAPGYVKQAQQYIPSLPSIPSFGGRKASQKDSSLPADAEKQAADAGQTISKATEGTTEEVVKPTVDKVANVQDNPAVKAGQDTAKKAPIIHQAADKVPGADAAAKTTSDTLETTAKNVGPTVSGALDKAQEVGTGAASNAGDVGQAVAEKASKSSYSSYLPSIPSLSSKKPAAASKDAPAKKEEAAKSAPSKDTTAKSSYGSYLPSLSSSKSKEMAPKPAKAATTTPDAAPITPKKEAKSSSYSSYLPSVPGFRGSAKKAPPKLEKKDSGVKTPQASISAETKPDLDRKPSGVKSPPKLEKKKSGIETPQAPAPTEAKPDLDRKLSGVKSPPKLGPRKESGLKSPPAVSGTPGTPKLEKVSSGVRSPPPKLNRLPSGATKSQPVNMDEVTSGLKSPSSMPQAAVKASEGAAGKGSEAIQGVSKQGTDAVKKAPEAPQAVMKAGGDAAGKAAGVGQSVTKQGTDAVKKAPETPKAATKAGKDVAGKAGEVGQSVAKQGTDIAKKAPETPKAATKAGKDIVGKAGEIGQGTAKQGTDAIGGAAGKASAAGQVAMKQGTDTATKASEAGKGVTKQAANTASKASEAGRGVMKQGTDATSKASEAGQGAMKQGTDAVSGAATKASEAGQGVMKQGANAASGAASAGQGVLKQGGNALGSAGSALGSKLPGWGR